MVPIADLKNLFNREQTFIILLSRLYFKTIRREEVVHFLKDQPLNYEQLNTLITIHSIRPFIYHVLSANELTTDTAFMQQLKSFYLSNQIKSMEQLTIASKTISDLQGIGVTVIPYKGVGLSYNYYGNVGLRESSDIDLLVKETDVLKTEAFLKGQNYKAKTAVPFAYWTYYKKNFKEISYTVPSKQSNYSVEVQWKLLNIHYGKYPAYNFFINGLRRQQIAGLHFPSLEPVYDFLAISSNHLVKDLAVRFKYVIDISCLIARNPDLLNSELIYEVANKYKCRKRMDYGFFLIQNIIGLDTAYETNSQYKFKIETVRLSLQDHLIKMKISDNGFIKRSLWLQDNNMEKIKFIARCAVTYPLPVAKEINSSGLSHPMIPWLIVSRLFKKGKMAFNKSFKKQVNKTS